MMKSGFGLAVSALLLMATLPAHSGAAAPGIAADVAAPAEIHRAARLASAARQALQKGDSALAVRKAEAAVSIDPDNAAHRTLLGRTYLAAGRLMSADRAFGDALVLEPGLAQVAVNRALTRIALGDKAGAMASLDMVKGQASEAEVGLALALAGHPDEALERLQTAARAADAQPRDRQNLAFVYALEGRWQDAAATAAQDVPADQMPDRLRRWALISQMRSQPAAQIAALLGIPLAYDAGQPEALALVMPAGQEPAPTRVAGSTPPPEEGAPLVAAVVAPPAPVALPAAVAVAVPAPASVAPTSPIVRVPLAPAAEPTATASRTLVAEARPRPRPEVRGRFVVQLGAFSSEGRIQTAWHQLNARVRYLTAYTPAGSRLKHGNVMLYRLSIGDFSTRTQAVRLCNRIKASGRACFVRARAGERPMQWAQGGGSDQPAA